MKEKKNIKSEIESYKYKEYKIYSFIKENKEKRFFFVTYPLFMACFGEDEEKIKEKLEFLLDNRSKDTLYLNKDYRKLFEKAKASGTKLHFYVSGDMKNYGAGLKDTFSGLKKELIDSCMFSFKSDDIDMTLSTNCALNTDEFWNLFYIDDRGYEADKLFFDNPAIYLRFGLNIQNIIALLEKEKQIDSSFKENFNRIISEIMGFELEEEILSYIKGYFNLALYKFSGIDKLDELDAKLVIGISDNEKIEKGFDNIWKKIKKSDMIKLYKKKLDKEYKTYIIEIDKDFKNIFLSTRK